MAVNKLALVVVLFAISRSVFGTEPVSVRYPEVAANARLTLSAPGGATIADGQWTQTVDAAGVTTRVVFHFKDGSLHDETVLFSQDGHFRLLRDHLVQRGPAFPYDIDLSIDGSSGEVRVVSRERDGQERLYEERLLLPADLSNGMVPTVLKNLPSQVAPRSVSLLVATPKPRLVRLAMGPPRRERVAGEAGAGLASHYVLHVEIGGLAGRLAPLVGRQPPDSHVWIADGAPPLYVRLEQPFYVGGPLWRIDLIK